MKNLFGFTKKEGIFPKDPKRRKKFYTFSSFVVLSIVFWLIIKLSQNTDAQFTTNISVENAPVDLLITHISHDNLLIDYQTVGARLLYMYLAGHAGSVELDFDDFREVTKDGDSYFYITGRQAALSHPVFSSPDSEVLSVKPDTLFLEVKKAAQKKVAVNYKGEPKLPARHRLLSPIQIDPDSVIVSGPSNLVEMIDTLFVSLDFPMEISKPVEKYVSIEDPIPGSMINLSNERVSVYLDVKEFTEAQVESVIEIDCPGNYRDQTEKTRLFPSRAKIFYLVALDDYHLVDAGDFSLKAECPFDKESIDRLKLFVDSKPANVEVLRLEPAFIEYILLQ